MIKYPYLPKGRIIRYIPANNRFMSMAREYAKEHSLDRTMPNCAVIVRDGDVIGIGANGSNYHDTHGCKRADLGCKTGERYELCEGCHPHNHGEQKALADAKEKGNNTRGADLYLWGHWWCCKPCWNAMEAAGIRDVYLLEDSEILFNREKPGNVVGRQFD